jgi:hypothetical protein
MITGFVMMAKRKMPVAARDDDDDDDNNNSPRVSRCSISMISLLLLVGKRKLSPLL